ncbi:hypothetical protein [Aurantiacibacter luteus]|uniref:Uncharacterized protein n=1 Tax=Aurantiacibacter luteus TaxID=1581420 RepID=A0A0G9MZC5_9SPHN|nr:hypothetical protein [Aurantiacibacter luteus]KLE35914.1 hypothetical protein AAW00_06030 [Aurantiacibacter luteus]
MDERDDLEDYIHAARNCTQMLFAIERMMGKALESLEAGDTEALRQRLAMLKEAVPQAIAVIDHDRRRRGEQDC